MRIPKVKNMYSPRSGNPVANQFIIEAEEGTIFQSYDTVIAFVPRDTEAAFYKYNEGSLADHGLSEYPSAYLDAQDWNYSTTTSKYRNEFLRTDTNNTRKMIKSGYYKLIDLNGGQ